MRKRVAKKLTLHRESLHQLASKELAPANGVSGELCTYTCPTHDLKCTRVATCTC
jgi:hypothetical protein